MLSNLRARRENDEKGFTLIELMVVVLIIAILIAIAIPTFLGARKKAQDRAAQSDVRNALTAEKTHYTDDQTYTEASATLELVEPSLAYVTTTGAMTPTGNVVYVDVSATGVLTVGAKSASGRCFFLRDDLTAGTTYAGTNTTCDVPSTWSQKW